MKEADIRNRETLLRYQELLREDCRRYLGQRSRLDTVPCPACGNVSCNEAFAKDGFDYVTCNNCNTLYARTRLSLTGLKEFYTSSESVDYWVREFFAPFAEARRKNIFRPRAQFLADKFGNDPKWLIGDIGAGYGIFLDELRKIWTGSRYLAIEPSIEQADICRGSGLLVECCILEDLQGYNGQFDLMTAFELFEHLYDPAAFLDAVSFLLRPGGMFFMTTLNGEGFDIQILWERSRSIYPPCHINFFNPDSLAGLLRGKGFVIEQLETPGKLDWDIIDGMICNEGTHAGRFWDLLARKGTPQAKQELQDWISRNGLSSHMMVLARKT